ncbi:hypothetical protein HDU87_001416 [Geranomyces variabilis]|uniref:RNA methyltransferase n=1 Tax=Geranomyces variabilis TaxID=109894 RepID=A0AAD5TMT1_9FUNG|nr:hypothetical protein HDU87_001416 [Geranomyces variabilis]
MTTANDTHTSTKSARPLRNSASAPVRSEAASFAPPAEQPQRRGPAKRYTPTVPRVVTADKGPAKTLTPRPACAHGNYADYYGKRSTRGEWVDRRLPLLEKSWIEGKNVIDVGCNAGVVTIGLAALFAPKHIEGVDIDPTLVRKARARLALRGSLVKMQANNIISLSDDKTPVEAMDVDDESLASALPSRQDLDYFPTSCPSLYGSMPVVEHDEYRGEGTDNSDGAGLFPHNVTFRCGDWLHEPNPSRAEFKKDVIVAFSITKWIHVNHGDAGLERFFKRCFNTLTPGGCLLLEPQLFETYRKAPVLFTRTMDENVRNAKLKPEDFESYLIETVGFQSVEKLGVPENRAAGFKRAVYRYVK